MCHCLLLVNTLTRYSLLIGQPFYYFSRIAKLLPVIHAMLNPIIYRSWSSLWIIVIIEVTLKSLFSCQFDVRLSEEECHVLLHQGLRWPGQRAEPHQARAGLQWGDVTNIYHSNVTKMSPKTFRWRAQACGDGGLTWAWAAEGRGDWLGDQSPATGRPPSPPLRITSMYFILQMSLLLVLYLGSHANMVNRTVPSLWLTYRDKNMFRHSPN